MWKLATDHPAARCERVGIYGRYEYLEF